MVTTGMPASTAACTAGAIASTSSGLMMMPSTPWVIAASMSAVCLVVWFWPSVSISLMSPSLSASSFSAFIMWTKNGNSSAGSDQASVSSLSWAPAAAAPGGERHRHERRNQPPARKCHFIPPWPVAVFPALQRR